MRAVIIANPTSGGLLQYHHNLQETLTYLREQGWQVNLCHTRSPGDARRLAAEAVQQKADLVIAAGGDGTINEIIQELAHSQVALGVLPQGTVNVWAQEVGIPLDAAGAREVLLHGRLRDIDLGRCNDRYFLLMAGIGLDGAVTQAVEKKPVKRLGVLGYVLIGTWLGLGFPGYQARLRINNKRMVKFNALQIVVGNTQLYGGAVKFTWEAKCDDGLLDICIVRRHNIVGRVGVLVDFLLRRKDRQRWIRYYTATSLEVRTRNPIPIQVDGESAGDTPARFSVVPAALKVLVPVNAPPGLFSRE